MPTERNFTRLKNERYTLWFNTFLNHTDEKRRMHFTFQQLAKSLYEKNLSKCQVLDIGCGEGTLSKIIAENLKNYCEDLDYYGIDNSPEYVGKTTQTLRNLTGLSNVEIQHGDFTDLRALEKLPNNPDVIIASHVAYYTNNIPRFISNLVKKTKASTALVFFHQSNMSIISELRRNYSVDISASPQKAIKESLESHGYIVLELLYPALITLPQDDVNIKEMISEYGFLFNSESLSELRHLLEFIVHAPLEYLENNNHLKNYRDLLTQTLTPQNGILIFWDVMQIATRYNITNASSFKRDIEEKAIIISEKQDRDSEKALLDPELQKKMEALTIGRLTPLEMACYEGNIQVILRLKSHIATHYNATSPFMGLVLAAKQGHFKAVQILLEEINFFDIDQKLDHPFKDKGFTGLHVATKHGYHEIVELLLKANASVHIKGGSESITPLYIAEQKCYPKVRNILLKYGTREYGNIGKPYTQCPFPLEQYIDIEDVIGRKETIEGINHRLEEVSVIIISGAPGMGKTTLAKAIGINHITTYTTGVFPVANATDLLLIDHIKNFTKEILGSKFLDEQYKIEPIIRNLYANLTNKKKYLFILDNAEKYGDIEWFLKDIPDNVNIIITTRDSEFSKNVKCKYYNVKLEPFSIHETKLYISKYLQNISSELNDAITKLTIPRQLELIVSYLKTNQDADHKNVTFYIESGNVSHFIFESLQNKTIEAWHLLTYLSYLNPDFIPLDILEPYFNSIGTLIRVLQQQSLVFIVNNNDGIGLSIHRETQKEVKYLILNQQEILTNLAKTLDNKMPLYSPYEYKKNRDLSKKYTATLASFLQHIHYVNTAEVANLYNKLGRVKISLTFNQREGLIAYSKALEIYTHINNSCKITVTYTNIGQLYYWEENWEKAIENLKKAELIHNNTQCSAQERHDTFFILSWCYLLNRTHDQALLSLDKALLNYYASFTEENNISKLKSNDLSAIHGLKAFIYFRTGHWVSFIKEFILAITAWNAIYILITILIGIPLIWLPITTFLVGIDIPSLIWWLSTTTVLVGVVSRAIGFLRPDNYFQSAIIGFLEYFNFSLYLFKNIEENHELQSLRFLNIWANEILKPNNYVLEYIYYNTKALIKWQEIVNPEHIFVNSSMHKVLSGIEKLLAERSNINLKEKSILNNSFNAVRGLLENENTQHLYCKDKAEYNKLCCIYNIQFFQEPLPNQCYLALEMSAIQNNINNDMVSLDTENLNVICQTITTETFTFNQLLD